MALSDLPEVWEIRQYADTAFMLAQQTLSYLTPHMAPPMSGVTGPLVELKGYYGKSNDVVEVKQRFADTGTGEIQADKSWTQKRDFQIPSPKFDQFDDARTLIGIQGPWTIAGAAAIARHMDRVAIGSSDPTNDDYNGGIFGLRWSGQHGTTAVPLPTTDYATVLAAGGDMGTVYSIGDDMDGSSVGLTPKKLAAAEEVLHTREVIRPGDTVNLAVNDRQLHIFRRNPEVINKDYEKDIVRDSDGNIMKFGMFNFVRTNGLPVDSGIVSLPIWITRYLVPVYWMAQSTELLTHAQQSGAKQLLTKYSMNVTRLHEEGFLVIKAKQ